MKRQAFTLRDIEKDCAVQTNYISIEGRSLGLKITVPNELQAHYPYSASVYGFLQELRAAIFDFGIIEFPNLVFNKTNYTLAQSAPKQHLYSSNTYMTDHCQSPHQDTPPYPTAFGLEKKRQYFATWIMGKETAGRFYETLALEKQKNRPQRSIDELHKELVPLSIENKTGILLNQEPGLLLIDNSQHQNLYHARSSNFAAIEKTPNYQNDTPMYAFNEMGLLHYIDELDSRRGDTFRCNESLQQVQAFLQPEALM